MKTERRNDLATDYEKKSILIDASVCVMIICTLAFYDYTPIVLLTQILALAFSFIRLFYDISTLRYRFFLWWTGFVFFSALSIIWTVNTETNVPMIISILQTAAIGFVIIVYAENQESFEKLIKYIIIANVTLCFRLIIEVPKSAWGTSRIGNYIGYGNDGAAIVLSFGAILVFCSWIKTKRLMDLVFVLMFVFFSLFTGSRKGILIISIGIMTNAVLNVKNIKKKVMVILLTVLIICLCYYLIMNNKMLYDAIGNRIESLVFTIKYGHRENISYNNSSEERMLHIQYAWQFFKENPIIGLGLDGYRKACPIRETYAHNNMLEILADFGIIGGFLYYSFPIGIMYHSIKALRDNKKYVPVISFLLAFFVCDIGMVTYNDEFIHIYFPTIVSFYFILKNEEMTSLSMLKKYKYIR